MAEITDQRASDRIMAARTTLILDQPFFGVLALRLKVVEDLRCGTAWTDGVSMGYSPRFINGLTQDEIVGLVAHEVMHCAAGHPWRRDAREKVAWNVAADYAINYVLEEARLTLPKDRLRDPMFDGQSAEWIYNRLPPSPSGGGSGNDGSGAEAGEGAQQGKPGCGGADVRDAPGDPVSGDTQADWQQAVQQAANAAQARGELPSSLKRFAEVASKPKVDWRSVLHRFVQQVARNDYSWQRPNPRYLTQRLYLPSLRSEEVGPIYIVVDTSGSIDGPVLNQFGAEINAVVDEVRPSVVMVGYCDAMLHRVDRFESGEPVVLNPIGGGGTRFEPAFEHIPQLEDEPVAVIYLTDLMGSFPKQAPEMPVLWAATLNREVPFGEVVHIND